MSSSPPPDPLITLWQTTPESDAESLILDVRRLNRLHRRLSQTILSFLWCVALLLLVAEITGRIQSHGILPIFWTLGLLVGARWRRRARCSHSDVLAQDTVRLLQWMIKQARKDLFLARCLYAGVPLSAAVSYFACKLAGFPSPVPSASHFSNIQTAAGLALLIAMMLLGAILSRSRSAQLEALTEKLKIIQQDL